MWETTTTETTTITTTGKNLFAKSSVFLRRLPNNTKVSETKILYDFENLFLSRNTQYLFVSPIFPDEQLSSKGLKNCSHFFDRKSFRKHSLQSRITIPIINFIQMIILKVLL